MKFKKFRVFIPLFIFLMLGLLNFNSIVYADSVFLLADFDDEPSGATSGTSGLFEFEGSTSEFKTSNSFYRSAPNSYRCFHNGYGYLNLTTNFNYVSVINFSVLPISNSADSEIDIRDSDDNVLMNFKFIADETIFWKDDAGYETLYDMDDSTWYYITITHLYTNWFNISVYSDADVLLGSIINCSCYNENWETFDNVRIMCSASDYIYVDNFYISTTGGLSEWETCYGDYTIIEKRFDESIVGYGDQVWFDVSYDFDEVPAFNFYVVQIINSTGYICRSINAYELSFMVGFVPKSEWGEGTYYIRARWNTDSQWDVVCPFTVQSASINPVMDEWSIESEYNVYSDGQNARIFYRIPDGYNGHIVITLNGAWYDMVSNLTGDGKTEVFNWYAMGEGNTWGFWLVRYNDTGYMNYTEFIVDSGGYGWELDINGRMRDSVYATEIVYFNYEYYGIDENMMLCIYNSSTYNTSTLVKSSSIGYGSQKGTISWRPYNSTVGVEYFYVVLQDENGYIYDDGIDRILSVYDDPEDVPYTTPEITGDGYVLPVVFMTALVIGGMLYYISSSGVFAGVGFMGALMFFATPGHAFSYLPTVYLFVMGLVVVVFVIFMFRS